MTARQTSYLCFPRNGWGRCRECNRKGLTFYVNAKYLVDREAGRNALSDILCRRCIDRRLPLMANEPLAS